MNKNPTLATWVANWKAGAYRNPLREEQIKAGWYDWFCRTSALAGRLARMAPKVVKISKSSLFDPDKVYVFFKNNCPCDGPLYDDFRICDMETGTVLFTVTPPQYKQPGKLWGFSGINGPWVQLLSGDGITMQDIYKFFQV